MQASECELTCNNVHRAAKREPMPLERAKAHTPPFLEALLRATGKHKGGQNGSSAQSESGSDGEGSQALGEDTDVVAVNHSVSMSVESPAWSPFALSPLAKPTRKMSDLNLGAAESTAEDLADAAAQSNPGDAGEKQDSEREMSTARGGGSEVAADPAP